MSEFADTRNLGISLDVVSYAFGTLPVLKEISVRINFGEIVAVLGPSGCGKTTLLHLVGGLMIPTQGYIQLAQAPRQELAASHVFQEATLLPWRSVAENIALPLEHLNISRGERDQRVTDVLARVNLIDFAQAYPRNLSGGMKQRVNLARALVVRPRTLLMDEPFSSLDNITRDGLVADVIRLWKEAPFTCLFVTHNPSEAVRLASRVIVLTARPARIRKIIPIDLAIDKRHDSHPIIVEALECILNLIRMPD